MEQKIRSELWKMSGIMAVLLGLGIYAHEFVIAGIKAKMALNLSIFALAGLAAWLAFHHVLQLKNEVLALKALQVDFGSRNRRPVNPYKQPAIVFNEPELLGQGYKLISEELGKQETVQLSNHTAQTLLHDIDQRINDRKSTIMYFSGLMVFLGLLGAFMGLMKTVHSVSDLIGGMDLSGASGTEGMSKMIEGMKAPLNGMSVGFSSSLFGLMTSMVLGALERCMTSAMKALRNEFEHWLSNLTALSGGEQETIAKVDIDLSPVKKALDLGSRQIGEMRQVLKDTAGHAVETRAAMGEMAEAVTRLSHTVEGFADPAPLLKPIADVVSDLARNQMAMLAQFNALYERAEADRAHISGILHGMTATMDRMNTLNGEQLHRQMDSLVSLQSDIAARPPLVLGDGIVLTPERPGLFARLFGRGPATGNGISRAEVRGLRRELRRMMASHRRLTRRLADRIGDRIGRMEAGKDEDSATLYRLLARTGDLQARMDALAARLDGNEAGSALADEAGFTGARREMEVLRRRLSAEIGEDAEGELAPDGSAPTDQPADRTAGQAKGART